MYQLPTVCLACLHTTNIFADIVLELLLSHIDWALVLWRDLVCASWICKYLFNLFSPKISLLGILKDSFGTEIWSSTHLGIYFYIFCVEWILSEMLIFEMLIEIYIDDQHMNQCHYFKKIVEHRWFECSFLMLSVLGELTFPLESERFTLVDFGVIEQWQHVHFWGAGERN